MLLCYNGRGRYANSWGKRGGGGDVNVQYEPGGVVSGGEVARRYLGLKESWRRGIIENRKGKC